MNKKRSQRIMIWFLPIVLIGGMFWPAIGCLVIAMMAFFLMLSFFQARFWCWNLCPRGSFLDIVLSRVSLNRPVPKIFFKPWFRWSIFAAFGAFLCYRLIVAGSSWLAIGTVFVGMCLLTTFIAVILGVATKHRAWCVICPMGNLQEQIGKLGKKPPQK
jgi:ferredoxin-type protein NapH